MKKFLLLTAGILFLFSNVNAQLVANAGGPIMYTCWGGPTTIVFGGSPSALGGVPPYQYSWTDNILGNQWDTTANPTQQGPIPDMVVYLQVTDNIGTHAFDSVTVLHYPHMLFFIN